MAKLDAPDLAPTPAISGQNMSSPGDMDDEAGARGEKSAVCVSANAGNVIHALPSCGVKKKMERDTGFEPATSSLGSWHSTN